MSNSFTSKMSQKTNSLIKDIKGVEPHKKLGLGLSVASLALGIANYRNNLKNIAVNDEKQKLEQKSLNALQKIHKALATKQGDPLA